MQQQGGGGQQIRQLRRQPTGETVLTRWVGHFVVVKYLAGPADPADPEDPTHRSRCTAAHADVPQRTSTATAIWVNLIANRCKSARNSERTTE
jgi:hypothetical protein